jgi:protein SCO1/2
MLNVRLIAWRVTIVATAIALVGSSLLSASELPSLPQQRPGLEEKLGAQVPLDLDFVDENGHPVKLADLVDRPTILAPVYYRCSNVCNLLQGGLAEVLPKLNIKPGSVRIVSLSFDVTETPNLARSSRRIYQAMLREAFPTDQWSFLTGDQQNIDRLLGAIGYQVARDGVEFIHPVTVAVLAPDGKIVRYLYGTRFLPMDVSLALLEASEGRVGNTISRIASICFSYDPAKKGYVFNILRVSGTLVFLSLGALFLVLVFGGRNKSTS